MRKIITAIKFRLILGGIPVGYEVHKQIKDGLGGARMWIYHSKTDHELSWKEICLCPKEYIIHDTKEVIYQMYNNEEEKDK